MVSSAFPARLWVLWLDTLWRLRERERTGRFEIRANLAAALITLLGLLARLWAASGIFLNPDEALHFRLANQVSLALAYKASLTAAHPPLLILLLYFWRALGTSELWLRLPSVLAGAVFCWVFYKWLSKAAGNLAGLIGLLFVAFLPPIILVAAEVRQYSLLLAFLVSALYFLDEAFAKRSTSRMAAFTLVPVRRHAVSLLGILVRRRARHLCAVPNLHGTPARHPGGSLGTQPTRRTGSRSVFV